MLSRKFVLYLVLTVVAGFAIAALPDGNLHNKVLQLVFSLAGLGYLWLTQRRMEAVRSETVNLLYMRELGKGLNLNGRNSARSNSRMKRIINEASISPAIGIMLLLRAATNWIEWPSPNVWFFVVVSGLIAVIVFCVLSFWQQRIENTWKPPALKSSLPRVFFDTDRLPTPRQSHKD